MIVRFVKKLLKLSFLQEVTKVHTCAFLKSFKGHILALILARCKSANFKVSVRQYTTHNSLYLTALFTSMPFLKNVYQLDQVYKSFWLQSKPTT